MEIIKLEDSRNRVIAGAWGLERTAGGCHLYDKEFEQKQDNFTWVQNPKYQLKLTTREPTEVKITLSRPEKAWKKNIGANLVGSMIGFYVYPGGVAPNQDNIINKEQIQFVPWNELSLLLVLDGNQDGYVIMPATYEARQAGPFILSVSTDVDFSLEPYES